MSETAIIFGYMIKILLLMVIYLKLFNFSENFKVFIFLYRILFKKKIIFLKNITFKKTF